MLHLEVQDGLHGNVPDRSGVVLLLVDVINDLDFPGNEYLLKTAPKLAASILRLKHRCSRSGIPTIYVNDNKGRWRSDVREVLNSAQLGTDQGKALVQQLAPAKNDYIVLKPKHSVFLGTPLDLLLQAIGAHTVIMAGLTTNACVLISASEIYMRGLHLIIPRDCVAALSPELQKTSLKILSQNFGAEIQLSSSLKLPSLKRKRHQAARKQK